MKKTVNFNDRDLEAIIKNLNESIDDYYFSPYRLVQSNNHGIFPFFIEPHENQDFGKTPRLEFKWGNRIEIIDNAVIYWFTLKEIRFNLEDNSISIIANEPCTIVFRIKSSTVDFVDFPGVGDS